jgi:hypothetical protein
MLPPRAARGGVVIPSAEAAAAAPLAESARGQHLLPLQQEYAAPAAVGAVQCMPPRLACTCRCASARPVHPRLSHSFAAAAGIQWQLELASFTCSRSHPFSSQLLNTPCSAPLSGAHSHSHFHTFASPEFSTLLLRTRIVPFIRAAAVCGAPAAPSPHCCSWIVGSLNTTIATVAVSWSPDQAPYNATAAGRVKQPPSLLP